MKSYYYVAEYSAQMNDDDEGEIIGKNLTYEQALDLIKKCPKGYHRLIFF